MKPSGFRRSFNRALQQANLLSEAAPFYTEVLKRFPDHPDPLDLYGVPLHQTGHDEAPAALHKRALVARPESGELHNHLGVFRRPLGELEGAHQSFTTICSLQPDMAEVIFNLATTLSQLGRYHGTEAAALKAANLLTTSVHELLSEGQ